MTSRTCGAETDAAARGLMRAPHDEVRRCEFVVVQLQRPTAVASPAAVAVGATVVLVCFPNRGLTPNAPLLCLQASQLLEQPSTRADHCGQRIG